MSIVDVMQLRERLRGTRPSSFGRLRVRSRELGEGLGPLVMESEAGAVWLGSSAPLINLDLKAIYN